MKKILFLCGHYALPTDSNSICVKNLVEEFFKSGDEVWVMTCTGESNDDIENNNIHIIRRRINLFTRIIIFFNKKKGLLWILLFRIIQAIRYVYTLPFYPNVAPIESVKLYKKAKSIIDKYSIDTVVATYRPYETISTAIKLKEKYDIKIKVVTYHLDLMTSPRNTSQMVVATKEHRHKHAIEKEIKIVDQLLLPTSAPFIDCKKAIYVDFPLFVPNKRGDKVVPDFDSNVINITYVGTIDRQNRNPHFFLSLLSKLPHILGKPVILHFWGKMSDNVVQKIISDSKLVNYHGIALPQEVPDILSCSDFLLNIGNAVTSQMIPSKIFQYFASSRPIISVVRSKGDVTIPYFLDYKYTFFVNECECGSYESKVLLAELETFIENNIGIEINIPYEKFEKSTPKFICDQIRKEIK